MAEVVFAVMGSWGDLFPTLGLATAAAARGHGVTIATTSAYASLVDGESLRFAATGPRFGPEEFAADPAILDGRLGGYAGFLHLFRTIVFPNLVSWVEDIHSSVAGADLLVSHPAVLAGPIAAELAGTRWATFSVFPGLIPSAHTLPSPSRARFPDGPAGRRIRRVAWHAARLNIRRSFDPTLNAARAAFGLAPVRDALFLPVESGNLYLVGASPRVVEVPPDWPANVRLTGFFAWDTRSSYCPPDELRRFLDEGAAPILITLGGSSAVDPQRFYPDAVVATRRLGHRRAGPDWPHARAGPTRPRRRYVRAPVRSAQPGRAEVPRCRSARRHRNHRRGAHGGAATTHRAEGV